MHDYIVVNKCSLLPRDVQSLREDDQQFCRGFFFCRQFFFLFFLSLLFVDNCRLMKTRFVHRLQLVKSLQNCRP